jgi:hypothetical protein
MVNTGSLADPNCIGGWCCKAGNLFSSDCTTSICTGEACGEPLELLGNHNKAAP